MKICFRCKKEKKFEEFGIYNASKDGRRNECKECRRVKEKKPNSGRFKKGEQRYPEFAFKKGDTPWNKGKKLDYDPWNKGLLTDKKRKGNYYYKWANSVKDRDNWTCKECGDKDGIITAHHIIPWFENEEKRFDIDNGKTLCQKCHSTLEGYQKGHNQPGFWKGKKLSEEHKKKLSESHKGKGLKNKNGFKKGMTPWNKGLKKEKV